MKDIVIVGAGPNGLYQAIRLAQKQPNANITVVDHRLGKYTRDIIIQSNGLLIAEKSLGCQLNFPLSDDDQQFGTTISAIEKTLYALAKKLPIHFAKSQFVDMNERGVTLSNDEEVPCDLIIDCTGARRSVVLKANDTSSVPPFSITRVGNNPIKDYLLAHITITKSQSEQLKETSMQDPVHHALMMETLRTQFQWQEFSPPFFTIQTTQTQNDSITLFCYLAIPEKQPNESTEYQRAWLSAVVKLYYRIDDFTFEVKEDTPFSRFTVDPHYVSPAFCSTPNLPTIIVAGDALIGADFSLGISLESGVRRTDCVISACTFNESGVHVDFTQLSQLLAHPIEWHLNILHNHYETNMQTLIGYQLEMAYKAYSKTHEQYLMDAVDVTQLEAGHDQVMLAYSAITNYQALKAVESRVFEQSGHIRMKRDDSDALVPDELSEYEMTLTTLLQYARASKSNAVITFIEKKVLHLIEQYKAIATLFIQSTNPEQLALAHTYFEKALSLIKILTPESPLVISLYTNLAITANERKDHQTAIDHCVTARKILSSHPNMRAETPPIIKGQLAFHHWKARLQMPQQLESDTLNEATLEMDELLQEHAISPVEYNAITKLIAQSCEEPRHPALTCQ